MQLLAPIPTTETFAKNNQPISTNKGRRVNSLDKDVTNTSSFLENNSNTDQLKKDLAARIIQRCFKKNRAAKAYKHMFDNGEYFKQYKEISSEPKPLLENLKIAQKLSNKAIKEIIANLGNLSEQERKFVQKIIDLLKPTLRHQTTYDLAHQNNEQKSTVTIKSNRLLAESGVVAEGLTKKEDIEALSNNDFVFTSVDFSGEGLDTAPKHIMTSDDADHGYQAYLTHHEDGTLGYLTLTDHYYNRITKTTRRYFYCKSFPRLEEVIYKKIHGSLGKTDIPIFTEKDMRLGLALHAIKIIREAKCDKLNQYIYADDISLSQLDYFLNMIFTPEFHTPRILSTTNFKLHKLREPTPQEVYKLAIFHKQADMIRQHYLGKYSTKDDLININTQEDMDVIFKACSGIIDIMDEAIKDANIEVLSCGIYWCEKIKNTGFSRGRLNSLDEYKVCLGALQPTMNLGRMLICIEKMRSKFKLLLNLQNILLKTDGFNLLNTEDFKDKICTYLANISLQLYLSNSDHIKSNKKHSIIWRHDNCALLTELYTMIDKIEKVPDYIIGDMSYTAITQWLIPEKLFNLEYQGFNSRYAKLIAKLLMKNEYNLEEFAESLNRRVSKHLPKSILKIPEDNILGVLYNPNITQEAKNTLQQAFIDSGFLNPEKKINASKDITLRDYAKEHYNIDL
jgi:hypothetical protein